MKIITAHSDPHNINSKNNIQGNFNDSTSRNFHENSFVGTFAGEKSYDNMDSNRNIAKSSNSAVTTTNDRRIWFPLLPSTPYYYTTGSSQSDGVLDTSINPQLIEKNSPINLHNVDQTHNTTTSTSSFTFNRHTKPRRMHPSHPNYQVWLIANRHVKLLNRYSY